MSVVIPVYNQASFVAEAIESVLGQSCAPFDIVVVDDGSTDATRQVCERFAGRITYIRQENSGPAEARNAGMRCSSGGAVMFLDADDLLAPRWLEQAIAVYQQAQERGRNVGVVHGDHMLFLDGGGYTRRIRARRVTVPALLRGPMVLPSGMLIDRACMSEVGDFRPDFVPCEDWDYCLRMVLHGFAFARINVCAFQHREHSASLSKRQIPALHATVRFLSWWLESPDLPTSYKRIVRRQLARTYLALHRVSYYSGERQCAFLEQAVEADPAMTLDPMFFIFSAVYAAPFFRRNISRDRVKASVEDALRETTELLEGSGRFAVGTRRRLKASALLALAADDALRRRYVDAGRELAGALAADPTMIRDVIRNTPRLIVEVGRAWRFV